MTLHRMSVVYGLVVAGLCVATVAAHMRVQKTMPADGATLTESPPRLQVWYTQSPDPAISRITLEGAGGAVRLGETAVADDRSLMVTVPSVLPAGAYTVSWRTAGDDGHTQRGDFTFTIQAAD